MSLFDNIKGTLKSLVGKKTDTVIAEAKTKVEETPVVEEVKEVAEAAIDTTVDNVGAVAEEVSAHVDTVVEQAAHDLENIHTENQ